MGKKLISARCQLDKPDGAIRRAMKIVGRWPEQWKLKEILRWYEINVEHFLRWEKRLKNPVHHRTGKPLKESTLNNYQRDFRQHAEGYQARKLLIRLFVLKRVFGDPKKPMAEFN